MIFLLLILLIGNAASINAQIRGMVVEEKTKFPIPFASISYEIGGRQARVIADKQGLFTLSDKVIKQLNVSCLGYKPATVTFDVPPLSTVIIGLEEQDFSLQELLVRPQDNPALRIIRKVLQHKHQNNFENYDNYAYRCYFKTIADFQTSIANDSTELKKEDTAILISETVTLCQKSGNTREEKIIASRTSGLKTPIFGQASYTLFYKMISFYNNSVPIFGDSESNNKMATDYVSPLSNTCLSAYNYQLEEEYVSEQDTIFEISYFPKKNKNFSGLMGTMFISSNGYALASIIAQPFEKGLIDFKFKQNYRWIADKWFPDNLEEEIGFRQWHPDKKSNAYPAYFISSSIENVSFDVPEKTLSKRLESVFLDEKSIARSQSILDSVRPVPLMEREIKTYHTTDSLLKNFPMDAVLNSITKIEEGKVSVTKFDVDFARLYSYNRYEGSRYGLGLHTNENGLKFLSVGAYIGYGEQDKKTKYGGDVEFTFDRSHDVKLTYSYQNSLKEAGHNLPDAMDFMNHYYRNLVAYRFDRCIENKIEGSYHISPPLKMKASLSVRNLTPLYDYTYQGHSLSDYASDEMQFSIRYAPGAWYSTLGNHRMAVSAGNPVFNLSYVRGVDFLRTSGFSYNKWETSVDVRAYDGRIGQSNLRIEGGYIDSPLPYSLLFTGEGSKDKLFSLFVRNTFQTMLPYEFLSDSYVHAFYSHNFGSLLFKTKLFSPEFLVAYNIGWGNLNQASDHIIDFKTQNHFYQETGLIMDNILRFKYLNVIYIRFGIGGFIRTGYYQHDTLKDNMALKISASISFK